MNLPEITEVQRLIVKPGDRIIVRTEARLDMATVDYMKRHVRASLGLADDFPVLILGDGMSLEVADLPLRSPWIPLDPDGLPPETYPQWRRDEIARQAAAR